MRLRSFSLRRPAAPELPEVSAFVRADEEDGIVAIVDDVLGVERDMPSFIPNIKRTVEGSVAYVKISDGCDRFCSFCAIPYIRGRYHSRPADRIIAEARELVAGGVKEIVLIGQDTGIWVRISRTRTMGLQISHSFSSHLPRRFVLCTYGFEFSICSPRA